MLLPSALACDPAQPSARPRFQPTHFVSPPASPTMLSPPPSSIGNIMVACRSLQSLMATPPASASLPAPSLASLPTPPMAHAPTPSKLRLRTPRSCGSPYHGLLARRRIAKRAASSGPGKRRRADEAEPADHDHDDVDGDLDASPSHSSDDAPAPPSTPKRARIAPEHLPLGLARSDFHNIHLLNNSAGAQDDDDDDGDNKDGVGWSAEDDRILVELVLDKLRLSKLEWQDCARSLGKDRRSVGRRWKSLMAKGDVGLKGTCPSQRARLQHTWR